MSAAAGRAPCAPQMIYPLPDLRPEGALERIAGNLHGRFAAGYPGWRAARLLREAADVAGRAAELEKDAGERVAAWRAAQGRLRRRGLEPASLAEALSVAGAEAARAWGEAPSRDDYAVALALLRGMLAVAPGHGTRAMALAAAAAAGAGLGVHAVGLDPGRLAGVGGRLDKLAEGLGLAVSALDPRSDTEARRKAYRADVTLVPVQALVQDALEDLQRLHDRPGDLRLRLERLHGMTDRAGQLRQRGLVLGLLLDADALLLDEALRTLAIAEEADAGEEMRALALAWDISGLLTEGSDYVLEGGERPLLTGRGRGRLAGMLGPRGGPWSAPSWREQRVTLALLARRGLEEELHYFVRPRGVELVDAAVAPLAEGLYARRLLVGLLSIRHGLESPVRGAPTASMSYMECFSRYHRLGGVMATADAPAARELWELYRLRCVNLGPAIPLREPRVELVRAPGEGLDRVSRIVAGAAGDGLPVLLVAWSPELAAGVTARLAEDGITVDGGDAAADPDARIVVPGPGDPDPDDPPLVGGRPPGLALLLHPGPDARRVARMRLWLMRFTPEAGLCQLLSLEDPRLQSGPWRLAGRAAARLARSQPRVASWLARQCFAAAVVRGAARERQARREHRQVAVRLNKLLAFRGGSGH